MTPSAGNASGLGRGSVQERRAGQGLWLVRLGQGFLALSDKCTHLSCQVPWRADFRFVDPETGSEKQGWFRCPCHGVTYNDAGVRVFGPAPRSMDRYDVKISAGEIYIDFKALRKGTLDNASYAVQPET